MPVIVEEPINQPKGTNNAYFDIGIIVPIMVELNGMTFGYSGKPLLADWWYLTNKLEKIQSNSMKKNQKTTSKLYKWLFRKRKKRFRSAMRSIIYRTIQRCYLHGVAVIYIGDLTGIRDNTKKSTKINQLLHNFWSHAFITQAIRLEAEEYGIQVIEIKEYNTSSLCPRCRGKKVVKRKRLFKCNTCKLEAHRDSVGAVNMRFAQESFRYEAFPAEVMNKAVARPQLFSL
ncbi:MAG: zinc ribbon domain-containing protein [Promethearchaeota archaeon]